MGRTITDAITRKDARYSSELSVSRARLEAMKYPVHDASASSAHTSPSRLHSSLLPDAEPMATRPAPPMATTVRPISAPFTCSPNQRAPT